MQLNSRRTEAIFQRTVIGRSAVGRPRTYRLAQKRNLLARMLAAISRTIP
jgi:hypothetical protein